MALPLLLIASAFGGLYLSDQHKKALIQQDANRGLPLDTSTAKETIGRWPSDAYPSSLSVTPVPGSIVCCSVYQAFDHTGVVIDEDTIVELHGSGLVRAVSPKRFLSDRSGRHIFIACNQLAEPFVFSKAVWQGAQEVFNFYDYHVFKQNCYRHTWLCLTECDQQIDSFEGFNQLLSDTVQAPIYWDVAAFKAS